MKALAKSFVAYTLALLARAVVRKYRPKIVMVTGSVGKTSTKDALAAVLRTRFYLRASEKSYNTEFGVPFTIFGAKNPWTSPGRWARVFKEAFALIILPNHYPNLLVLEVGADRPGDLQRILKIATPDAVVITRLPEVPVHVEAYATPEALREEEFAPAYALAPGAPLIINSDDLHAVQMSARVPATRYTYGEDAGVSLSEEQFYVSEGRVEGMQAKVVTPQGKGVLIAKGSVGYQQVLPPAAALTAALALGVGFDEALKALADYVPPPGRGRLLKGIKGSTLIDDTYNASPAAAEAILKTLKSFPGGKRRVAILGDMLELGRYSVAEHQRIGALAKASADLVISVGIRARAMGAKHSFDDSRATAEKIRELIQEGDVILIKGSQSLRLERVVEALLADPSDCTNLVRQEREWKTRS